MDVKSRIVNILKKKETGVSVGDLAVILGTNRTYVSKVLRDLRQEKIVISQKKGRSVVYHLNEEHILFEARLKLEGLDESKVLNNVRMSEDFTSWTSESARSVFEFAFPEMLNNAIDHSESSEAYVSVFIKKNKLKFVILDFGVGIFQNLREKLFLKTELEAIPELLKGKITTAPRAHSGMGVFFTSKIADKLKIKSHDYFLEVDNEIKDIFVGENQQRLDGTEVSFEVDRYSQKSVIEIFRSYAIDPEEGGFDKTEILVKLYKAGTIYVSRSQARALVVGLEKFKKVMLDFSGVEEVGQAFADEIFRVFNLAHPEVEVEYQNANEAVEFMIKLAKSLQD